MLWYHSVETTPDRNRCAWGDSAGMDVDGKSAGMRRDLHERQACALARRRLACHFWTRGGMMRVRNMGSASAPCTASASVPSASYRMRALRRPYTSTALASVSRIACARV